MHVTAAFWSDKPVFNMRLGNYIGGFEDKHNAADTFLVLIPISNRQAHRYSVCVKFRACHYNTYANSAL